MALNYVTLVLDLYDAQGNVITTGSAAFTPSVTLTDPGVEWIPPAPIPAVFHAGGLPQVRLLATDSSSAVPGGWTWAVTFTGVPGSPAAFSFFLPFSGGATQYLSALAQVPAVTPTAAYLPLPTGVASAGNVPIATGSGEASAWGSPGAASLPLTTLGDTLYEDVTPAPVRLAGNTTATKKYLTQTGTGTVSAAPGWNTIAAADLPTLDLIPAPAAAVSLNSKKITNLTNGSSAQDAAAFGQLPSSGTPLPLLQGGTGQSAASNAALLTALSAAALAGAAFTGAVTVTAASAAGATLVVKNNTSTPTGPTVQLAAQAAADNTLGIKVSGEANFRMLADSNGKHQWGPGGATAVDTNLYRSGAGALTTDGALTAGGLLTAAGAAMGANKITGLANGSAATDAAAFGQIPVADATAGDITLEGTQAAGSIGKWADAGHIHPAPTWLPSDNGLLMAFTDPAETGTSNFTTVAGTVYLTRFTVRSAMTISKIWIMMTTAGTGASSGSFVGLYNGSGTLLTGSADVAASLFGVNGPQSASFTTPQAVTAGTVLYAAIVQNMATIQPAVATVAAGSITRINVGLTSPGAALRCAVNGTAQTSLPGSITPSSNTQTNGSSIWVGLS